jgi:hypothetical protein
LSVEIPKCTIAFGAVAPPQGDIVDLQVHLGCTKEVSSFEVMLQNWNKKYSPGGASPILVGVDGHINIGRGVFVPQLITCRVESVKCESTPTENYIRVSGRCWGEKLFRRTVTKTYENKKGEEIIKDLLDYYVGLSHVRYFDGTGVELVEDTDTTFTKLAYENTPVWDIIKCIAESSDLAGVIGYDFRVAFDGKFEFFAKNSKASEVSISEKIEGSEYRKDIHRIRNKIISQGASEKQYPSDVNDDGLTETTTDWTADDTVALSTDHVKVDGQKKYTDSYSICSTGAGVKLETWLHRTFSAIKMRGPDGYKQAVFWHHWTGTQDALASAKVRLYSGASYFEIDILPLIGSKAAWTKVTLQTQTPSWTVSGTPNWDAIDAIRFIIALPAIGIAYIRIDHLRFCDCRYSAIAEHEGSQTAYGLRELVEVDEELHTNNECLLRAKALLAYLKDPAEYLTARSTVIDYGSTPIKQADKIHIILPNENIGADFRIETVEYHVDAKMQTLEVTLELGKVPPMLADYLYGLRATTTTVEKLARTKLGKGGIPGVGYGGGGMFRSHHTSHEAGDDNGVQWPTEEDGGVDKLSGWIAPKHIGPFENEVAIIKFRTQNKAGTVSLDHQFRPSDNEYGIFGSELYHWKELHSKFMVLYHGLDVPYGDLKIKVQDEANPKARLTEELLEFGPGGAVAADVYLKRLADNKFELKTQYLEPQADNILEIGSTTKRVKLLYISSLLLPTDGYLQIKVYAEDNPKANLTQDSLAFGPGGATVPDTWFKRTGAGSLEVKNDLMPTGDNAGKIGVGGGSPLRWSELHVVDLYAAQYHFGGNLLPDAHNTYDIGSADKEWRDIYIAGKLMALAGGVSCHLMPDSDGSWDLGDTTKEWRRLFLYDYARIGSLIIKGATDYTVITSARVLQDVTAGAAIITTGQFPLARMPRGEAGQYIRGYGAEFDPMYASISVADLPDLPASKITSEKFLLARLPNGTSGYVLEGEGGSDPMYVDPNGRYTPASHQHSHGSLSGIGPNDHHAQSHSHAGETISPSAVSCNTMSIAVSCNRQYSHPSSQQCVYAASVAWEYCPHFGCKNYSP